MLPGVRLLLLVEADCGAGVFSHNPSGRGFEPHPPHRSRCALQAGWGLNASTDEYVDLIKDGIIDPAKVTRSALQNAASIAALFLITAVVIVDRPERNSAGDPSGGVGGMDF